MESTKFFYTIKEFANKRNVSQQAIYKQLSTSLKPYMVEIDGQKYIKSEYFDEHPIVKKSEDKAINEIREKIIDLIVGQDTEIQVRHENCNQYVDFEVGKGSGYRRALQIVDEVMVKYGLK